MSFTKIYRLADHWCTYCATAHPSLSFEYRKVVGGQTAVGRRDARTRNFVWIAPWHAQMSVAIAALLELQKKSSTDCDDRENSSDGYRARSVSLLGG